MFSKKFTIIFSIFLVIALTLGGGLGYYDAKLEAAIEPGKKLDTSENKENLNFDKDVVNILLIGSDHGAQGAEEGDHGRSDSMMVATVNFKTKELKITSFLRDMYVEIPDHGKNKLNAAYAFGGEQLLYDTLAQNFNIKIDKFCVVDLSAFEKVINRLGGIEMTLEEKEAEYLNSTNYISKKKYRNVKAGKQTLNGNQALGYARIRYVVSKKYGDGDFGRTGRQRAVLQAALNKVLEQNPVTIANIALDALNDVSTDMSAKYLKSLVLKVAQMGTTEIDQLRVPLESTYKMGRAQNNMFVFFINFDANKAALEYFLFNKGTEEDWAKEYGGVSGVETFGYSGYSSSSGGSSNSDSTSYNTSQTRSTSSTQSTRSESTSTSKSTTTSRPKATTAAPTTEAPTTAAPATEAPATEAE